METLPSLIYALPYNENRSQIDQWRAKGLIRRIGHQLYTSLSDTTEAGEIEKLVYNNWNLILKHIFPETLISHKTAMTYLPDDKHQVFLTGDSTREVSYPGLHLLFRKGPPFRDDDDRYLETLRVSSLPRALLENLAAFRGKGKERNLPREKLEIRLERILNQKGEGELNSIRDRAGEIADEFGWSREFKLLNELIGGLLGTHKGVAMKSSLARARALGAPYDEECFHRLNLLFSSLKSREFSPVKETYTPGGHWKNKAFFESYFSNYIEGTRFKVEEAAQVVFEKKEPDHRPQDAHDIYGTYLIVSDLKEMNRVPHTVEELVELLQSRHKKILEKRPEVRPGEFKEEENQAGNTFFVSPEYVEGTLEKGFSLYQSLDSGIERAVFVMFLVNEVHPFADGNGRVSRIMLNAELTSSGLSTVIIPNVYREDYILALRALSRQERPDPVANMILRAQKFSALDFVNYQRVLDEMKERNWFEEPSEARIID